MAACEKERKTNAAQSWQEMSDKKKWLHREEILEVVKKQRLAFESAEPGLPVAQESVRYLALLFYTCLPVAQSKVNTQTGSRWAQWFKKQLRDMVLRWWAG